MKDDWAQAPLGQYTVPLIGVPRSAGLEVCDYCGNSEELRNTVLTFQNFFICAHCYIEFYWANAGARERRVHTVRKALGIEPIEERTEHYGKTKT